MIVLIVLVMMLSWMWDLPIALYPGAPPLVLIRGKPTTNQPLKQGYIVTLPNATERFLHHIFAFTRALMISLLLYVLYRLKLGEVYDTTQAVPRDGL